MVAEAECTLERPVECRDAPGELAVDESLDERVGDDYVRYGFVHRTTGGSFFNGMVVFVDEDAAGGHTAGRNSVDI